MRALTPMALVLLLHIAGCGSDVGEAVPPFSGDPGPYVGTESPEACAGWSTVTPPEDFDAICRPDGEDLQAVELEAWELVNADRVEHAEEANFAQPLSFDCAVAEVARLHSYDQCKASELAHVLHGKDPGDRLEHYLQLTFGQDFFAYGENIAWYPMGELEAMERGFVEEEPPCDWELGGHRMNILSDDFEAVGVGYCACAGDANFYLTQNFITFDPAFAVEGNAYCEALEQGL